MDVEAEHKKLEAIATTKANELEAFRKQFNIEDKEKFSKAVLFCEKILDGTKQSQAYAEAFGVTIEKARTVASQFHRGKWIQELLLFMKPDERTLYFGQRKRIIEVGLQIIDDRGASRRDKIEAMKALQPYIKQDKIEEDEKLIVTNLGESISDTIDKKLELIASQGKMLDADNNIIDVTYIE